MGELILAYTCPDCGRFHIGHADRAQILARQEHEGLPCQHCGGVIPEFKKQRAQRFKGCALYCSDGCQKSAAQLRRRARQDAGGQPAMAKSSMYASLPGES